MTTVLTRRVLVGLTLLSIASPLGVLADDDHDRHHNNGNDNQNWHNNDNHHYNDNHHGNQDNNQQWHKNQQSWHQDNHHDRDNWNAQNNLNQQNEKLAEKYQRQQNHNYQKAAQVYDRSHWQTNYGNNWNDQREWYAHNMRNIQRRQANENQRQLEEQMRQQYLMYNNNNYNGPYGWDQYSDPRFLDYLHTSRPNLLTTIRSMVGM